MPSTATTMPPRMNNRISHQGHARDLPVAMHWPAEKNLARPAPAPPMDKLAWIHSTDEEALQAMATDFAKGTFQELGGALREYDPATVAAAVEKLSADESRLIEEIVGLWFNMLTDPGWRPVLP